MQRFDVLGDDYDTGIRDASTGLLAAEPDDALQAVVTAAAIAAEAPISLVSLMLRRIQLFRAHVGLPPDLAAVGATDRCVSFCQVVTRDQAPLLIEDALHDVRVPQELVGNYGLRAYYGVPLKVGGKTIGSLCVLDVRPRTFTAEQCAAIEHLAEAASRRLAELVRGPDTSATAIGLENLRTGLASAVADTVVARIAAIELRPRLRAFETPGAAPALAVLSDAGRSADDLDAALVRIDASLRRSTSVLGAVERSMTRRDDSHRVDLELRDVVTTASALVQCPVRWRGAAPRDVVATPAAVVINQIGVALLAMTRHGARPPLDLAATIGSSVAAVRVEAQGLTASAAAEVMDGLSSSDDVSVRADGAALVLVVPVRPRTTSVS